MGALVALKCWSWVVNYMFTLPANDYGSFNYFLEPSPLMDRQYQGCPVGERTWGSWEEAVPCLGGYSSKGMLARSLNNRDESILYGTRGPSRLSLAFSSPPPVPPDSSSLLRSRVCLECLSPPFLINALQPQTFLSPSSPHQPLASEQFLARVG